MGVFHLSCFWFVWPIYTCCNKVIGFYGNIKPQGLKWNTTIAQFKNTIQLLNCERTKLFSGNIVIFYYSNKLTMFIITYIQWVFSALFAIAQRT